MPSIIIKFQKCGKSNCKCEVSGLLHGPYYWLVTYRKRRGFHYKSKYIWRYIGKTPEELEQFITEEQLKLSNVPIDAIKEKTDKMREELRLKAALYEKSYSTKINLE